MLDKLYSDWFLTKTSSDDIMTKYIWSGKDISTEVVVTVKKSKKSIKKE
jgi:hypothetical protein